MRGRAEVDGTLAPVEMPGRILNELYTHARLEDPQECCGLILGDRGERFQEVRRCSNIMSVKHEQDPVAYPRDGREAFYMNEQDYVDAHREAESRGLEVTAVYHSHVGSAVYLSETDLVYAESELFPFPDSAQIVISVSGKQVHGAGIFLREHRGAPFFGRSVLPSRS